MGDRLDLITTGEAARLLGVSIRRVQQFIKAGQLPATKAGRDWLIRRADLDRLAGRKPGRPKQSAP